ncbi:MAG: DUF2922 domain-containing protein [Candidatus Syntrophonatronum acetioxidans]|uniref:DUF2922 domain-containing protein n=1 Tax=Candidatus Syntrophonatronum acetioxidans TaxID=1795816 RepID=A0A424Y9R1_9FIRM|nr:MAG: DUF2922 domain-containing protein [Candidatus Syntrophonatronum acetioxidans]
MAGIKRLRMRFRDSNDRVVSFTVNPALTPVNESDVLALMDLIINSNSFYTFTGGDIISKVDAILYTIEEEEIEIGIE